MIKISDPYIPDSALKSVMDVLRSGHLIQGQFVHDFETALAEYIGTKHAILVSSGTAALWLSLKALEIQAGDEVIVPAFTFPATANVVELVGARPVLADIRLDDFCLDPDLVESKITKKTKAIMPVHEFGQSAEMAKIMPIAASYGLKVIEDAACALGAECQNKKVGAFGALGCFSFHPRKAVTTGEGGAVVTNDDELADRVRLLRNHGIQVSGGKTDFVRAGFNFRLTDFQAALGLAQFAEIEDIIEKRIRISGIYDRLLADVDGIAIPGKFAGRKMVYQTYYVLLDEAIDRDGVIEYLKRHEIETNYGAYAIHQLTYYKDRYHFRKNEYPKASWAFLHGLVLPFDFHLNASRIKSIVRCLKNAFSQGEAKPASR